MAGLKTANPPTTVSDVIETSDVPGAPATLREMARDFATQDPRTLRREIDEHVESQRSRESEAIETATIPAWSEALIPQRFRTATFGSFAPASESQRVALAAVREWVKRTLASQGTMLALIGSTGAGKSHLLYAAARALAEQDRHFYARPWYRLADELRYGGRSAYNPAALMEPAEMRQHLWDARIAMIDEVRPTASTAFDDTELAKYACNAYDSCLSVLITSNVNPLTDVMGPAAASRFTQVVIEGPDRRQSR